MIHNITYCSTTIEERERVSKLSGSCLKNKDALLLVCDNLSERTTAPPRRFYFTRHSRNCAFFPPRGFYERPVQSVTPSQVLSYWSRNVNLVSDWSREISRPMGEPVTMSQALSRLQL